MQHTTTMILLIVFTLFYCIPFVFGSCHYCNRQSIFYEPMECSIKCRRKGCPTTYSCQQALRIHRAAQKCYFNKQYYDENATLPNRYRSLDGSSLCTYKCTYDSVLDNYFFIDNDCVITFDVPTEEQCNGMLQIAAAIILQNNVAVAHEPGTCKVDIFVSTYLPPSNCKRKKCCKFMDKLYKKRTVVNVFGHTCSCECPPLMTCI